jgi:coproporphyrinogen III oxidase
MNVIQHQKRMRNDEWQMTNDGGRITNMREGGIFEALSLFIVECLFVIVEWSDPSNDK